MDGNNQAEFVAGHVQHYHRPSTFDFNKIRMRVGLAKFDDVVPIGCIAGFAKSDEPFSSLRKARRHFSKKWFGHNSHVHNMYPKERGVNAL